QPGIRLETWRQDRGGLGGIVAGAAGAGGLAGGLPVPIGIGGGPRRVEERNRVRQGVAERVRCDEAAKGAARAAGDQAAGIGLVEAADIDRRKPGDEAALAAGGRAERVG